MELMPKNTGHLSKIFKNIQENMFKDQAIAFSWPTSRYPVLLHASVKFSLSQIRRIIKLEAETFCTTLSCKSGRAKAVYVDPFLKREKFIIFECLNVIFYNMFCNKLYYLKSEQFSTKLLKVHSESVACERHIGRIDFLREQNKHLQFLPI